MKPGCTDAYLYGVEQGGSAGTEGLNAFFLLVDKPEVYNLPPDPVVPTKKVGDAWASMAVAAAGMALAAIGSVLFSRSGARRDRDPVQAERSHPHDGRDIDPNLGTLSGEAGGQGRGRSRSTSPTSARSGPTFRFRVLPTPPTTTGR